VIYRGAAQSVLAALAEREELSDFLELGLSGKKYKETRIEKVSWSKPSSKELILTNSTLSGVAPWQWNLRMMQVYRWVGLWQGCS
jgi:hypothetical protein